MAVATRNEDTDGVGRLQRYGRSNARRGTDLAALLVVTIWGVSFVFQKATLEELDPLAFTFARFVGMLALGWAVLAWRARISGGRIGVARADLPRVALAGLLGYTLYILPSTLALSYTTAFSNALLIGTAPLFSAVLLWRLKLERIRLGQCLAVLVSCLGVTVFLSDKLRDGWDTAGLGDLISLLAAFFFAAYRVANKPLLARYPVSVVMAHTLTLGAIPVLILSLPATLAQDWAGVSAAAWAGLAWLTVVPVYVAWTLWSWAIARVGVARTSVFMYLVPIVGGVASWLLLGEGFGPLKLAGAILTLTGLALARRSAATPAAPPRAVERGLPVARPGA
jgi:drug/metabolite transporter (DMT)-like permease